MANVIFSTVTFLAPNGASIAEPVAALSITCIKRVLDSTVRRNRAASRTVLAIFTEGDLTFVSLVFLVAGVAPTRPWS